MTGKPTQKQYQLSESIIQNDEELSNVKAQVEHLRNEIRQKEQAALTQNEFCALESLLKRQREIKRAIDNSHFTLIRLQDEIKDYEIRMQKGDES